ncbi:hypothetical protein [Ignavigranum ruoffiae]|nr:hypothetical protein [Ignavigranum ruoffiae]
MLISIEASLLYKMILVKSVVTGVIAPEFPDYHLATIVQVASQINQPIYT